MLIMRRVILLATLIAASFSFVGCNSVSEYHGGSCPNVRTYSPAEQKRAAQEIRSNPNGELARMVRDYGLLRKACRI